MNSILSKIADKSATVGVLGLGYVGIPLALRLSQVGYPTIGFDVLEDRIEGLNAGLSPIKHIEHAKIAEMRQAGFVATNDFSRAAECDVLIICVPTPLDKAHIPDLSFVTATMESIAPYLRAGQLLSLESTTWPGTTEEVLLPYVTAAGLEVGKDFYLAYSPEREDPGNIHFSTRTIPKVVGGHTPACLEVGTELYATIIDQVVAVSSTRAAEMVKLLENIHRSVNIGLVNELKIVTQKMGLDIFEIVDAAATKPFGFTPYYPGPGIGGHCIPIDPFYLTWKAKEYGVHTRFIELAGEINQAMPDYVVGKTVEALNKQGKALKGATVLALGIAYKRDVDDMRESPSVFVMEKLRDWGAEVAYSDPNVPVFPPMREHSFELTSVELSPEVIAGFDAVLLLTDHTDFDYDLIRDNARLLIDTRGKYRDGGDNIWKA
ncbi:MAG: nucleotide sugar dehydrogenase [Rhodobacteraceae bacterium]|nr:nucleotide sugar dehydrogenase [Paracoccaceae bacterium]